jgi:hypothetical protein
LIDSIASRSHVVRSGIEGETRNAADRRAGQRIKQRQVLDLTVEQLDANGFRLVFGRKNVDHLATHAIAAAAQFVVAAFVLQLGESAEQLALVDSVAAHQMQHHLEVFVGIAEAVNRRYRGNDQCISPLEQCFGRRQAHLLDVLVDARVLFDVRVRRGHIGFRLIVVVVRDEVLDRVVRKELFEFAVQLRSEGFVRREHQRWFLDRLHYIGDGEGLAGAGDAQQGLRRQSGFEAFDQSADRLGLVASGRVRCFELETIRGHGR